MRPGLPFAVGRDVPDDPLSEPGASPRPGEPPWGEEGRDLLLGDQPVASRRLPDRDTGRPALAGQGGGPLVADDGVEGVARPALLSTSARRRSSSPRAADAALGEEHAGGVQLELPRLGGRTDGGGRPP